LKLTADVHNILQAINRIKIDLDDVRNRYPYMTIMADETGGAVFATDTINFIESRFSAIVEEAGLCQVDRRLGQILTNISDDQVALVIDGPRLRINGVNGFKGRLQTVSGAPVPYEIVREKMDAAFYDFDGTFNKSDLASLLRLSKVLPESEDGTSPYKCIILDINGEEVKGSTQESAVGAIESVPIRLINYNTVSEAPIRAVVDSARFESMLSICTDEIRVEAATLRSTALRVYDPQNPTWWGTVSQMSLRSDKKD
jgi:hypothetical protein